MLLRRMLLATIVVLLAPWTGLAQQPGKGLVIVLIGPPGSGKTSQAEFLKREYGIPGLTIDDLIRENPEALAKKHTPGIDPGDPHGDPALNDLVRGRVSKFDRKKGFVLDGYPSTKEQADYLGGLIKEFGLAAPIIFQLDIPDDVVRERTKKRGTADDRAEIIERRLKDYHREMDMVRSYYPEADIWTLDGTHPMERVSKTMQAILMDERSAEPEEQPKK